MKTDACPLPVLALSLWTWFGVPMLLVMALTGLAVMPCFGVFVSGLAGALVCLVIIAVWGWAGWWLILITMLLFTVSALLTYAHHDISEMYQLQGLPPAQIDQIQKMCLFTGNRLNWCMALFMVPFVGYLLFIQKYLRHQ